MTGPESWPPPPAQPPARPGWQQAPPTAPTYGLVPEQAQWGPPRGVVTAKSSGVAVLLSFLWLGAGHLYTGATGVGIALLLFELFVIIPLSFVFVGVLLWFLVAPFVMYFAAQSAHAFNRRNGIVVR